MGCYSQRDGYELADCPLTRSTGRYDAPIEQRERGNESYYDNNADDIIINEEMKKWIKGRNNRKKMQVLFRRQSTKNGDHDGLHLLRTGIQCRTQLCECVQKCSGQQKSITKNSEKIKWARKREKCAFADMLGFILSFIHCTSTQNAKTGYEGALCKTC